jgi:hypothetical protein
MGIILDFIKGGKPPEDAIPSTEDMLEDYEDVGIQISDRSRLKFVEATQAVGDHLNSLPLTSEQYNILAQLFAENLREAEIGAFGRGFALGRDYGRSERDDDE